MDIIETFSFSKNGVNFTVGVVCYQEFAGFSDQWEMTDKHQGGVTIANPDPHRNSYKYGVPVQCSLAELSRAYAEQGRDNPSSEAYQSLQDQLRRDISASDYGFLVSAEMDGVNLFFNESLGCAFDWSYEDEARLEDAARDVFFGNGGEDEAIELAKSKARKIIDHADKLKEFAA